MFVLGSAHSNELYNDCCFISTNSVFHEPRQSGEQDKVHEAE